MKKKTIMIISLLFFLCFGLFAKTYHIKVTGDVTIKTEDNKFFAVETEADVEDTDSLIIGENSSVIFYIDGKIIEIQTRKESKTYKVSTIISRFE